MKPAYFVMARLVRLYNIGTILDYNFMISVDMNWF